MNITVSNRLEILSARLADDLVSSPADPLASETVILQSRGMQKWLSLELAHQLGICANYRFPFPNKFLEEVFETFIPEYIPGMEYDINVLSWKLIDLIPTLVNENDFQPLRNYLGSNYDNLKLYQLANRIAVTFDQYLIFRPEMVLQWEEGLVKNKQENWQALLWQKIVESQGPYHKARLRHLFLSAEKTAGEKASLPQRISIFGISYLTPYHLSIFSRLSRHIPVNFYYLNPSQEFWADIKSGREIDLTLQKYSRAGNIMDDELLHLESGNRLLASMGSVGRDFFWQVAGLAAEYVELFAEPEETNLLSAIQSDIYLLRDRGRGENQPGEVRVDDGSVQIHSCHSPLREVETLHNTLLGLFAADTSLTGKDILVMTPNIEVYAPYIEAVFDSRRPKIPYSITDRSDYAKNPVIRGFTRLLDLCGSRFTVTEVLGVLENPAISEKFNITAAGRELIKNWTAAVNIKWGINKTHRKELFLPEYSQNTWQDGINSLLAGIALDGRGKDLFAGILPYGEIEGEETDVLGNFLEYWVALLRTKELLSGQQTLDKWCGILKKVTADFFPETGNYREDLYKLHYTLNQTAREQQAADSTTSFDLSVIKCCLQKSSGSTIMSSRYLSGGVTFCAMLPMRSIPFDVICLIGMDNEVYPRKDNKAGFDLTQVKKQTGDRSLRGEDQYLFLEAILSARKNLIISYVGQDAQDNSKLLPSTLVNDLLDYVDQGFCNQEGKAVSGQITKYHHLHEFNPEYFRPGKGIFSYSRENYLAAQALKNGPTEARPFIAEELHQLPPPAKEITVNDLLKYYSNPVKYFLEERLCLKLSRPGEAEEQSEPFEIDKLEAYQIKRELLDNIILNMDENKIFEIKKAQGVLPVGAAGDYYFSLLKNKTHDFAAAVSSLIEAKKPGKINIDMTVGDMRLTGTVDSLYDNNLINYRPAVLKVNDCLKTWISHLLISSCETSGIHRESILLGDNAQMRFSNVSDAQNILASLIEYYRRGQIKPVKFFPRTSWEYARNLYQKQKSPQDALQAAGKVWFGDDKGWTDGEALEIANKICFADLMPLDADFENTTREILGPLFSHIENGE